MAELNITWGTVADWVSGLGSLSAAVVALYLAKRSERIDLKGYCGFRVIVTSGVKGKHEIFCISVTNVSPRATVVNNIGIAVGRIKKRSGVINILPSPISSGVPVQIADGQNINWHIPLDAERSWVSLLCKDFVLSKSDAKSLRFAVHTNHGKTLVLKPERSVVEALLKEVSKTKG